MPKDTILVVDHEASIRWSLAERLKCDGYDVLEADTGRGAMEQLPDGIDLVLLDYRLPDTDSVTILRKVKEFDPDILVVLLTAFASVPTAVEAMKLGADHFVNKPFNLDDVAATVARALETTRLRREVRRYRTNEAQPYTLSRIVGASAAITALRHQVARVASTPGSTVLLTGESGTGKDLVARIIHYGSHRTARPFMNITCSAIPEHRLESDLFGHERGAFTDARAQKRGLLETADGGTVFLDEIGEMTAGLQAKLLHFLEEKSFQRVGGASDIRVDVRVIAATNRDLEEEVARSRFRADLFYRLNVLPIATPPLRTHSEDVPALVEFFIDAFNTEFRKQVLGSHTGSVRGAPTVRMARQCSRAPQRGRAGHAAVGQQPSRRERVHLAPRRRSRRHRLRPSRDRDRLGRSGTESRGAGVATKQWQSDSGGRLARPEPRPDSLPDRKVTP